MQDYFGTRGAAEIWHHRKLVSKPSDGKESKRDGRDRKVKMEYHCGARVLPCDSCEEDQFNRRKFEHCIEDGIPKRVDIIAGLVESRNDRNVCKGV